MSKIIMELNILSRNESHDIEVSDEISAYELVYGLNKAYGLGIDTNNITKCFLRTENPIALVRGDKKISELGLRNGTTINVI